MELIDTNVLAWPELVRKISLNPAEILGINKGIFSAGGDADVIIVDAAKEFVLEKKKIVSKSKNSPFIGKKVKGLVEYTIYNGKIVYKS